MTNSKLDKMRDDRARDHANYVYKIAPYKEIDNEYSFRAGFDASTAIHQQQISKLIEAITPIYLQMKRGIKTSTKEELLNLENAINQNQGE